MMAMMKLVEMLSKHKGRPAAINQRESEQLHGIVLEVEPNKIASKSISVLDDVNDQFVLLNYFDAKELYYIPLEKIVKITIRLRDR
jgi:hypothetical protein